ncbi:NUDIX hydrolase [Halobium salinum]|uniref:NUDIX hydrolase n=1 Tax=Halobium salinum TaxID=1364940 RepID=A0ABD5PA99_9EURY|nr:NUDIX hydrolase [Halobium salinum]
MTDAADDDSLDGPTGSKDSADPGSSDDAADPLAWETTDTGIDYSCPGFDVRRDDVRLPDGTETDYHYVDERAAVVVLPFVGSPPTTGDSEVVTIAEWRQAVSRVSRGLPAGTLEPDDDDLAVAARRELREETGYEAGTVEHLTTVEPVNGIANSVHHAFVAHGCEPTGEQELDFNESIRVETTTYDDLLASVVDGDCRDGRTALAVMQYELTRQ